MIHHKLTIIIGVYYLLSTVVSFIALVNTAKKNDDLKDLSLPAIFTSAAVMGVVYFPIIVFGYVFKLVSTLYFRLTDK